ncbi:MAG: DUF3810 domain-containing protein [Lachnospiraceae bacterium]|jgi:hypothetical protein|nr:DUF3810 domain-containing protein [Lachnospiraceae bacterium]
MKKRERNRKTGTTFLSLGLLAAALGLQILARKVPGFAQLYAGTVYRFLVEVFGRIWSLFPFSVAEIGLYGLVLFCVGGTVFLLRQAASGRIGWRPALMRACRAFLLIGSALFFSYTVGCGMNYCRTAFSVEAGLSAAPSSREDLAALCTWLAEMINDAAGQISQDENGCLALEGDIAEEARRAMENLGEEYPVLEGYYPRPKAVAVSRMLSVQKIEGIYSPFTLEANYNREMPDVDIPVTMCHELSHLRGFMREDEANFIAWLACVQSGDPRFIYSGAILAYIHSSNALYRDGGEEEYREIYDSLCDMAKRDLAADSAFWRQFDGKVAEVSSQVNDAYLKANKQEDGVKSYGRMVDLLLSMYREGRP